MTIGRKKINQKSEKKKKKKEEDRERERGNNKQTFLIVKFVVISWAHHNDDGVLN